MSSNSKSHRPASLLCASALLALLGATALLPSGARADGTGTPPDEVLAADSRDSISVLLTLRDRDQIRRDLDAAHAAEGDAGADAKKAGSLADLLKARIQVKKGQVDEIKGRVKLAKEQNNDADKARYESDQKAQELQRDLLESFLDLRTAEKDAAEAREDAAHARATFFERELEFGMQLAEAGRLRGDSGAPADRLQSAEAAVRKSQGQALEALKDMLGKAQSADKARAGVADRRLKVAEVQAEIAVPGK